MVRKIWVMIRATSSEVKKMHVTLPMTDYGNGPNDVDSTEDQWGNSVN